MPQPPDPRKIHRRPFISKLQKGSRFPRWPERTRKEMERLRVTTPQTPAIPPRWLRIAPVQYLKERWPNTVVMISPGRKAQLPVRLVLTAGQPPCRLHVEERQGSCETASSLVGVSQLFTAPEAIDATKLGGLLADVRKETS
jgi:hypothetical protein